MSSAVYPLSHYVTALPEGEPRTKERRGKAREPPEKYINKPYLLVRLLL